MDKINLYTQEEGAYLIIETALELQFELRDENRKLIMTGNKLQQPAVKLDIRQLVRGKYLLRLDYEGLTIFKWIDL